MIPVHALSQLMIEIIVKICQWSYHVEYTASRPISEVSNVGLVSTLMGDYLGTPDTVGI